MHACTHMHAFALAHLGPHLHFTFMCKEVLLFLIGKLIINLPLTQHFTLSLHVVIVFHDNIV